MEIIKDIVSLIASIFIFLGSIIALISAIGIVKFQDVFLRSHASTKSSTLSVLLTVVGVLIYFIVNSGFQCQIIIITSFYQSYISGWNAFDK